MAVAQRDIPLVAMEAGALQQLIAVASIGFLGTFCYAVASFGRAIVIHMVWGSLALFMPALGTDQSRYIDLVTLITLQGIMIAPFQLWFVRNDVLWRALALISTTNVAAVLLATYLMFIAPVWIIKIILSVVFMLFGFYKVAEELKTAYFDEALRRYHSSLPKGSFNERLVGYFSQKKSPPFTMDMFKSWSSIPAALVAVTLTSGALTGLLQGISGVGGPPMIIWTMQLNLDKLTLRGTSAYLLAVSAFTQAIFLFLIKQTLSVDRWSEYLLLLVFSLIGLVVGNYVHDKVDFLTINRLLLLFLLAAAISMLSVAPLIAYLLYFLVVIIGVFLLFQSRLSALLCPRPREDAEKLNEAATDVTQDLAEDAVALESIESNDGVQLNDDGVSLNNKEVDDHEQ